MSVKVRLPGSLRDATGGETRLEAAGGTLAAVVADLERRYPALRGRILDERGGLQSYVNVYIGGTDARHAGGGDALVPDDADVMVIPAMSGGEVTETETSGGAAAAVKAASIGGLIELVATDPGCGPDLRAWSRQTGNEVVETAQHGGEFHFVIRRLR